MVQHRQTNALLCMFAMLSSTNVDCRLRKFRVMVMRDSMSTKGGMDDSSVGMSHQESYSNGGSPGGYSPANGPQTNMIMQEGRGNHGEYGMNSGQSKGANTNGGNHGNGGVYTKPSSSSSANSGGYTGGRPMINTNYGGKGPNTGYGNDAPKGENNGYGNGGNNGYRNEGQSGGGYGSNNNGGGNSRGPYMSATNNAPNSNSPNSNEGSNNSNGQYHEVQENEQASGLDSTSYQASGEEVKSNYVTLKGSTVGGDTGGEKVIVLMKNDAPSLTHPLGSPLTSMAGMMTTTLGSPLNPLPGMPGMGASMTAPVFDSCIVPVNVCNSNNMMGGYGHSSMYGLGNTLTFTPAGQGFPSMNVLGATGYSGMIYGK